MRLNPLPLILITILLVAGLQLHGCGGSLDHRAPVTGSGTATMDQSGAKVGGLSTEAPVDHGVVPPPVEPEPQPARPIPVEDTERYAEVTANPVRRVAEAPVSTFSVDVDTAAYANVRRFLNDGRLPPKGAVRIEEMVNYFPYAYDLPETEAAPFAVTTSVVPTPWNAETRLLQIGIQGFDRVARRRPPLNLVFLIDRSGSMASADKLPLVKQSLRMLVEELAPTDRIGIVTYGGGVDTALEPITVMNKGTIRSAIDSMESGGGTPGEAAIRRAYALAEGHFDPDGVNRVILASDGDFNIGITDPAQLEDYIERQRETGVYLTVLGYGTGNLNDAMMQRLAQAGNGVAAYIDGVAEARKVLVDEMAGNLFPIADDVKIQVEFNPARVAEYRLIGFETRMLRREDFKNDRVDAGEIGNGHQVTALYEITAPGSPALLTEPLRYREPQSTPGTDSGSGIGPDTGAEIAFLRVRYKLPGARTSQLIERPVTDADVVDTIEAAGADIRFAAAVAAFGQKLRQDPYLGDYGFDAILALAQAARGADRYGYRAEFLQLVRSAQALGAG